MESNLPALASVSMSNATLRTASPPTLAPQYAPLPVERQVVIIYAGANGFLDDIPVTSVGAFEADLHRYFGVHHKDLLSDIATKQALDDDIKARMGKALEACKAEFKASRMVTK